MDWKNQLTKTPVLIFFILLGGIGVGTASALITITLAGDVIVTGDLTGSNDVTVGNDLYLGDSEGTHDIRFFEDGNPNGERFQWDDGNDQFEFSDDAAVFGDFQVQGQADVRGAPIINTRSTLDGNTANLIIQRTEGSTVETPSFALSHRTSDKDLWLYGFDGSTFKNFVGFDYPNYKINFPATSNTLVVDAANDKVGIGTDSPSSELEVVGDVAISGDLIVNGKRPHPFIYENSVNGIVIQPGNSAHIIIECDGFDVAIGGGFSASISDDLYLKESHVSRTFQSDFDDFAWFHELQINNLENDPISGRHWVFCLDANLFGE